MGRKLTTTLAALLLALGLSAGPALAQEGFDYEECIAALTTATEDLTDAQIEDLLEFIADGVTAAELEAFLQDLLGDPDYELPADVDDTCVIYLIEVLPNGGDDGGDGDGGDGAVDGADGAVDGGQRTTPGQVLGSAESRRLPMTGSDILWLAVIGSVILGLGILAVRAPRDQAT
jgi:LPXTG-motif cell wall-anchored protein